MKDLSRWILILATNPGLKKMAMQSAPTPHNLAKVSASVDTWASIADFERGRSSTSDGYFAITAWAMDVRSERVCRTKKFLTVWAKSSGSPRCSAAWSDKVIGHTSFAESAQLV